jgi:hypothetical protein
MKTEKSKIATLIFVVSFFFAKLNSQIMRRPQQIQRSKHFNHFFPTMGWQNVSAYGGNDGLYNTNIDRIANEGIMFTDHYAQPSCTAGRPL